MSINEALGKLYRTSLAKTYEWRRKPSGRTITAPIRWSWDGIYRIILELKKETFNVSDTILISGARRSGTTWLAELLCASPDYCVIFEPIVLWRKYGVVPGGGFADYIDPKADWPVGKDLFGKLFEGKAIHPHAFTQNPLMDFLRCSSLVIKSVNTNKLMPWLSVNFKLRGMILIIRHPCAVVASLKKHLPKPLKEVSQTHQQYVEQNLPHLYNFVKGLKTQEEIHAAGWCCEHHPPLKYRRNDNWIQVSYEKLVLDGENELKRICAGLNFSKIDESLNHLAVRSLTTRNWSVDHTRASEEQRLGNWRNTLDKEATKRVLSIVDAFGIQGYNDNNVPDFDKIGVIT